MSEIIKIGDVVQLRSGGPLMTVVKKEDYDNAQTAACWWFNTNDMLQNAEYPLYVLVKKTPSA